MIYDYIIGLLFGIMMFILLSISIFYIIKDSLEMKKHEKESDKNE